MVKVIISTLVDVINSFGIRIPVNKSEEEINKIDVQGKNLAMNREYKNAFIKRICAGILYEEFGLFKRAAGSFEDAGRCADSLKSDLAAGKAYERSAFNYQFSDLPEELKCANIAFCFVRAAGAYSRMEDYVEKARQLLEEAEHIGIELGLFDNNNTSRNKTFMSLYAIVAARTEGTFHAENPVSVSSINTQRWPTEAIIKSLSRSRP